MSFIEGQTMMRCWNNAQSAVDWVILKISSLNPSFFYPCAALQQIVPKAGFMQLRTKKKNAFKKHKTLFELKFYSITLGSSQYPSTESGIKMYVVQRKA